MTKIYREIEAYCKEFFQDMLKEIKVEDKSIFIVLDENVYRYYLSNLIYRKNSIAISNLFSGVIDHLSSLYLEYKFVIIIDLD